MIQLPETRYTTTDDGLRLAYQQWGEGPPMLTVPSLVSNIELEWEHELIRRSRERLGQYMTVVQFDKRGMGLSDRFDRAPTLDERVHDISCVMDAWGGNAPISSGLRKGER